jgi:hypothetical protein
MIILLSIWDENWGPYFTACMDPYAHFNSDHILISRYSVCTKKVEAKCHQIEVSNRLYVYLSKKYMDWPADRPILRCIIIHILFENCVTCNSKTHEFAMIGNRWPRTYIDFTVWIGSRQVELLTGCVPITAQYHSEACICLCPEDCHVYHIRRNILVMLNVKLNKAWMFASIAKGRVELNELG